MLHLFCLYKASTTLIMYNYSETLINETKQFPDGRHRLLYDMLIDKSEEFQSSYQFRALVLSILRYVKEKPCEKENINPTIVVDIKRLLAGFILKLFIRENSVDFNLCASDLNGHYRKLAELCFDIRKFDDGTVLNSMNKEFFVYKLVDHKINLTTSYIAFSFGTLAYELFVHLSKENKWTAAHSDYLLQNEIFQERQVKYAFDTAINHSNNIDYDLQNLLTTEFNGNNLKDKLRIQQNQGITDWVYCYSTKEVLDVVNKLVEVDLEKSDIAYEDNFETITKNHVILGLEDIYKHSHIFAKIPLLQYRDITKYEMLTTHDIPITDDATLLEWQSKMVKLEKRIKVLSEVVTRPLSGRAMRFSNNAVRDILH